MRKQYTKQLEELKEEVLQLHNLVSSNVELVTFSINKEDDIEGEIIESSLIDKDVRKKSAKIEALCVELLSLQQPLAKDLRFIVTVLKIVTDFERISRNLLHTLEDFAHIKPINNEQYKRVLVQIMGVIDFMLQEIYTSIYTNTPSTASVLSESDSIIDSRYEELTVKLYEDLKEKEVTMKQAFAYLSIARYLERVGDHICNIGEKWFYKESGEKTSIK